MAFHRGPKIVTDGLVMYYDTDNVKSYVGEPTTNLIISPTGLINNITTDVPNGVPVSGYYSDGTNYSVHYRTTTSTAATGNTFIFSAYMRSRTSPLSTYLFYVYTGTGPDGGWYNLGSGSLTSEWVRYTGSKSDMTGTVTAITIYRYNQLGTIEITGVQLEVKSHVTPFVDGSRSNTQGLLSLTTQKPTLDLTSMSYDSNAKLTFNGTSNDIRSLVSSSKTDVTLEGIVYVNLGSFGTYLSNGNDAGGYCIGIGSNFNTADNQIVALFGAIRFIPTGVYYQYTGYHHIVMTLDGSSVPSIYINGVFIGTYPGTIPNNTSGGTGFCIGSQWGIRYSNMKCNIAKFYNKKLNVTEVLQNFNAIKKRFGI